MVQYVIKQVSVEMLDDIASDPNVFDTTGATAIHIQLLKTAFTPGESVNTAFVAANEADFDGYVAGGKAGVVGVPGTAFDPLTGIYKLIITPPAGGWRWETTGLTNLPQTIYGWAVNNPDLSGPLDYPINGTFSSPLVLNAVNQEIIIDRIEIGLSQFGLS